MSTTVLNRNLLMQVLLMIYLSLFFMTRFNLVAPEIGFFKRVHVRIANDLSEGVDLKLHCKSKQDDLGEHIISYGKGYYEFTFRPRYFGETQFFCSFQWQEYQPRWSDIYIFSRDHPRCSECYWKVVADGTCLLDYDSNEYDLCYHWNKN
ncbi:hypothetical protein CJ030_MR1G019965 [Morella rubra]|uniref:S-protein homolog n=1 Tax=Morella rubra TaxID=262757 RepID=A0A6A1WQI8_9ROSI|nr:hypothetical protein CJ030_MR1G019965 [Morella rubra]